MYFLGNKTYEIIENKKKHQNTHVGHELILFFMLSYVKMYLFALYVHLHSQNKLTHKQQNE